METATFRDHRDVISTKLGSLSREVLRASLDEIGVIYHTLLESQCGIWTTKTLRGPVVLHSK